VGANAVSNKSLRSKEAIARKVESEARERPSFAGFAFAFVTALCDRDGWNEAEALSAAMSAPKPPTQCPACGCPCSFPVRDPAGDWTWNCRGGCNP
jgi:hypothetical protein